jgi:hypothetical protein
MNMSRIVCLITLIVFLSSCRDNKDRSDGIITAKEVDVASSGETITVELNNPADNPAVSYEPDNASEWIERVKDEGSGNRSVSFNVLKNVTKDKRSAVITIGNKAGDSQRIRITQGSLLFFSLKDNGWDIYVAGVYRYGPSIIINEDNTIDAWFAAPGGVFGKDMVNFSEGNHSPLQLMGNTTCGQRFSVDRPFHGISVSCPSWATTNSSLTLTLYKWNKSYDESLSNPVLSKRFVNYEDNQNLMLSEDDKQFPAGEYLWVLSEPSGTAGVWKNNVREGVYNFLNGSPVSESFESFISCSKTSFAVYWDQAAYRRSSDGGKTWTEDQMTLKPTEYTLDALSVCDPGLIRIGQYYYAGYTSTEDTRGLFNHVYVARSLNPGGPWEKWDGTGWSDNPKPVVAFDGHKDSWGAGEPSMVVLNGTLYFYYTWEDVNILETRVATADANDLNWPAALQLKGCAIDKSSINTADHCDVKYREDTGTFQAIHTASRMSDRGYLVLWNSIDGLKFEKIAEYRENIMPGIHNCGWSGDKSGHIKSGRQQYVSYAYGINSWAQWNTRWVEIFY